ncbi:lytic murein transglycosylase B [Shewanella amazonensis]|uniref:Lytic murein transglycosylase B n=1 Tax=Shewanella amazonensis (strain ATCC BAA-1098 / SB2B) TaxID=326297 RepID=A1S8T6_SHEAM|nr:lytic murein transglycosylase B [Shewanella amazonensis SB2B]
MSFAPGLALLSGLLAANLVLAAETQIDTARDSFISRQSALGFSQSQIDAFLAGAQYNPKVIEAISRPWEAKPWHLYRPRFLTETRLKAGLEFWRTHESTIDRASTQFGVEPEMIVAIIGIETHYGQTMGNYSVRDALYTLGFYYPPRASFFLKELGELQKLEQEEKLDVSALKGSYAGAIGFGQFMPSSYRYYGVDFDGDGRKDLLGSPADAIGSVANYFHQHGWQTGDPVAFRLESYGETPPTASLWQGEPLTLKASDILADGFGLADKRDLDVARPAMLFKLEQETHNEYWMGFKNFFVITRYNRSPLYAMAAYEFSEQLKHAHAKY